MESLMPIIIQVVTGILGGQAVSAAIGGAVMGQLPKLLSGGVGGLLGGFALNQFTGGAVDPAAAGALSGMLGDALAVPAVVPS